MREANACARSCLLLVRQIEPIPGLQMQKTPAGGTDVFHEGRYWGNSVWVFAIRGRLLGYNGQA